MSEDILHIAGGQRLEGTVALSGAKNSVLPLLAATLLADGECILENIPCIAEVPIQIEILRSLGLEVTLENGTAVIRNHGLKTSLVPVDLAQRFRSSIWTAGPLLARLRQAQVPLPGGCRIGDRPIDFHIAGFQALGAHAAVEHGYLVASTEKLTGASITLDPRFRSVGATINIALAATLAEGTTVIENAALEPEVEDVMRFLNAMGARVAGIGTGRLEIDGVQRLGGTRWKVIPDRIEAGTFLLAGAITQGDVTVRPMRPAWLEAFLTTLGSTGVEITRGEDWIRVSLSGRPRAANVTTGPFPLFATDLQPQTTAFLTTAEGISVVRETLYNARTGYVGELRRFGADIRMEDQTLIITGVERLTGAVAEALDIRAGAAVVLAAVAAHGTSQVRGLRHITRGYHQMREKFTELGAQFWVENASDADAGPVSIEYRPGH